MILVYVFKIKAQALELQLNEAQKSTCVRGHRMSIFTLCGHPKQLVTNGSVDVKR